MRGCHRMLMIVASRRFIGLATFWKTVPRNIVSHAEEGRKNDRPTKRLALFELLPEVTLHDMPRNEKSTLNLGSVSDANAEVQKYN